MPEQPSIRMQLADKLCRFRKAASMTIYEVGEQLGKSGKTINAWEHGLGQPDAEMLMKLCALYHVDIADLFDMPPKGYTKDEDYLIYLYRQLNNEGQEIIKNTAAGLVDSGKYR